MNEVCNYLRYCLKWCQGDTNIIATEVTLFLCHLPSLSTDVCEHCCIKAIAVGIWQCPECQELDTSYYVLGFVLSIFWILQLMLMTAE